MTATSTATSRRPTALSPNDIVQAIRTELLAIEGIISDDLVTQYNQHISASWNVVINGSVQPAGASGSYTFSGRLSQVADPTTFAGRSLPYVAWMDQLQVYKGGDLREAVSALANAAKRDS